MMRFRPRQSMKGSYFTQVRLTFLVLVLFILYSAPNANANTASPNTASQLFSDWFSDEEVETTASLTDQDELATKPNRQALHQALFGELVYMYFQKQYTEVLTLIEVGQQTHQFSQLNQDNLDRLKLMQGAAQLQLGLYETAQTTFTQILSEANSDYVQANTWFFMAKAGFENKQSFLTERAYEAISQNNEGRELRGQLTQAQWQELLYLTAYTRMQSTSSETDNTKDKPSKQDWQSLYQKLPTESIYRAYLLANHASQRFNQGQYALASAGFVEAKQALIEYQNRQSYVRKIASGLFDSIKTVVTPWRWFDANAQAQQTVEAREEAQEITEINALFDRINISLGQSLLQQGKLPDAIAVIENIAASGGEADQALLSYGWANAREFRWQTAMAAWRHIEQNSEGLFSLQASYALAYAFGQQDSLGQAFYSLKSTADQIKRSLNELDAFSQVAQTPEFFDEYNQRWPQSLNDLKLGFFSPTQTFDAQYLLSIRSQASTIQQDITGKQKRLHQLSTMLSERELAYQNRASDLSLAEAEQVLSQTQDLLAQYSSLLVDEQNNATRYDDELSLAKLMADQVKTQAIDRLENAKNRLARLQNDTSRTRPLSPKYQTRLDRIEGIIQWQLMDDFVAQKWRHQRLLQEAQSLYNQARVQYERLVSIAQQKEAFASQYARIKLNIDSLAQQQAAADDVFDQATLTLKLALLNIIDQRKQQLEQQSINTRLAMLRIQDLRQTEAR